MEQLFDGDYEFRYGFDGAFLGDWLHSLLWFPFIWGCTGLSGIFTIIKFVPFLSKATKYQFHF
jgi:hypothetical protein